MFWEYFDQQPIKLNFTRNDLHRNFAVVFKTKDFLLGENFRQLESNGDLPFKEKFF